MGEGLGSIREGLGSSSIYGGFEEEVEEVLLLRRTPRSPHTLFSCLSFTDHAGTGWHVPHVYHHTLRQYRTPRIARG